MSLTTVSFVLLLQDDFSGTDILDNGHMFYVDGKLHRPIRKPEGYYVFTGIREPCMVRVESSRYSPADVYIDPSGLNPEDPVLILRLLRSGEIRFSDCERVEGFHKPGVMIYAFAEHAPPMKIASAEKDSLVLDGYTTRKLARMRYAIGAGKTRELFIITDKRSDGSYQIDHPLAHRHKPGEVLQRVYSTVCDSKGRYVLAVEEGVSSRLKHVEYQDEESGKWVSLSVTGQA